MRDYEVKVKIKGSGYINVKANSRNEAIKLAEDIAYNKLYELLPPDERIFNEQLEETFTDNTYRFRLSCPLSEEEEAEIEAKRLAEEKQRQEEVAAYTQRMGDALKRYHLLDAHKYLCDSIADLSKTSPIDFKRMNDLLKPYGDALAMLLDVKRYVLSGGTLSNISRYGAEIATDGFIIDRDHCPKHIDHDKALAYAYLIIKACRSNHMCQANDVYTFTYVEDKDQQ